ncbi:MAG: trimeric intracellular cation channel family protein [Micrococcales bacterium]
MNLVEWWVSNGGVVFEAIGILAYALSGLVGAARKKLDIVGMAMVAAFAAFGGGTLRDILLDIRPFYWVKNLGWIYAIIVLCVVALLFVRSKHIEFTERAVLWPDAIGLGIFGASGTQIALEHGMPAIVAVVMGAITAVFGGVLRDIALNEIPAAFSDHQPNAIVVLLGSWFVVIFNALGLSSFWSVLCTALLIIAFRLAAIVMNWRLPEWKVNG